MLDGFLNQFSELPAPVRALWAKSDETFGHPLLGHMLDVAATTKVILGFEPPSTIAWLAQALGLPQAAVVPWLAVLVGLHDFGKAIPGFQSKWPQGQQADQAQGLDFNPRSCKVTRHDLATAALLHQPLQELMPFIPEVLRDLLQALGAHHGYHPNSIEISQSKPYRESSAWLEARRTLLEVYWQVLSPEAQPQVETLSLPVVNWFAGLTAVADWIASNRQWFPLGERQDDLKDYHQHACLLAQKALQDIGWSVAPLVGGFTPEVSLEHLLGRVMGRSTAVEARPLQQVGDKLLSSVQGPSLLLVEAPMGEGKTELAFLAHLRLQAANQHRGLYVALPTQATSNALFSRALTFLHAFTSDPLDIQLVHGGAAMNEQIRHLKSVDQSSTESLSASAWFSQKRRPLLSPYGVGTVDQALLSVLNVKHHFVRLWGLGNRVVVLDEVHAYDAYTSGLIETLLQWLKALGSSVVLMSATLPEAKRQSLMAAWGIKAADIPSLAYPRLLLADQQGVRGAHFEARPLPVIQLRHTLETLEALAAEVLAQIAQGGCGAVIVNTVDRAQQLYLLLRPQLEEDIPVLLFHARFPANQRADSEKRVLGSFGTTGQRPDRGLLIATQVAEQSLDLDFDFMLTDLAPVDLLLQRAGRLHRHQRQRPLAHTQPRLWVAGLNPHSLPELTETAWEFVYDAYLLGRTWALLSRESELHLPQDIDRLVQAVYSDEPLPDDLDEATRDHIELQAYGEYRAEIKNQQTRAFGVSIDPLAQTCDAYLDKPRGKEEGEGLGLVNSTRLGEDSLSLIPLYQSPDGLSLSQTSEILSLDQKLHDDLANQLYARQLRVSRKALVQHFLAQALPHALAEHPLLRDCRILPLHDNRYSVSEHLRLHLDEVLGLVIEQSPTD